MGQIGYGSGFGGIFLSAKKKGENFETDECVNKIAAQKRTVLFCFVLFSLILFLSCSKKFWIEYINDNNKKNK